MKSPPLLPLDAMSDDGFQLIPEFHCAAGVSLSQSPSFAQLDAAEPWSAPDSAAATCGDPSALDIARSTTPWDETTVDAAYSSTRPPEFGFMDDTEAAPTEAMRLIDGTVDARFSSPGPPAFGTVNATAAASTEALRIIDGTVDARYSSPGPPAVGTANATAAASTEALRIIDGTASPIPAASRRPELPFSFSELVSPAFASAPLGSFALQSPLGFANVSSLPSTPESSDRSLEGFWSPGHLSAGDGFHKSFPQIGSPLAPRGPSVEPDSLFLAPAGPLLPQGNRSVARDATRHPSPNNCAHAPAESNKPAAFSRKFGPHFHRRSLSAPNTPLYCGSRNPLPGDAWVLASVTACEPQTPREPISKAGLLASPSFQPQLQPQPHPGLKRGKEKPGAAKAGKQTPGPKALAWEGKKPHPCRVPGCQKGFRRPEHLHRHNKTVHCGERPHKCPKCNKPFSRLDNMTTHAKIHDAKARRAHARSASASSPLSTANANADPASAPVVRHFAPAAAVVEPGPGTQTTQFFPPHFPFALPLETDAAMLQVALAHMAFQNSDAY